MFFFKATSASNRAVERPAPAKWLNYLFLLSVRIITEYSDQDMSIDRSHNCRSSFHQQRLWRWTAAESFCLSLLFSPRSYNEIRFLIHFIKGTQLKSKHGARFYEVVVGEHYSPIAHDSPCHPGCKRWLRACWCSSLNILVQNNPRSINNISLLVLFVPWHGKCYEHSIERSEATWIPTEKYHTPRERGSRIR